MAWAALSSDTVTASDSPVEWPAVAADGTKTNASESTNLKRRGFSATHPRRSPRPRQNPPS
jgi:hypothetical protein